MTELGMREEFLEYAQWKQYCRKRIPEYVEAIDESLKEERYEQIGRLLESIEKTEEYTRYIAEIEYVRLSYMIYRAECMEHIFPTIFDRYKSLKELTDMENEFKFICWRFEFGNTDFDEHQLIKYIDERELSLKCVQFLINRFSLDSVRTLLTLAINYIEKKEYVSALHLLLEAEQIAPQNEVVLSMIANVYELAGRRRLALEKLEQINNPSPDIVEKKRKLELLLNE